MSTRITRTPSSTIAASLVYEAAHAALQGRDLDGSPRQGRRDMTFIKKKILLIALMGVYSASANAIKIQPPITWIGGSGYWNDTSHWLGGLVPSGGQNVVVGDLWGPRADGGNWVINYYNIYQPTPVLSSLRIDTLGAGTTTLRLYNTGRDSISSGGITCAIDPAGCPPSIDQLHVTTEYVGYAGTGRVEHDYANHVADYLTLGYDATANGTYQFNSGQLSSQTQTIGESGVGAFTQIGGTNNVAAYMVLGANAGSSGTYVFSEGRVVAGQMIVGISGTGVFTQNGSYNANAVVSTLSLAAATGGSGTFNLAGGNLNEQQEAQIGGLGTGMFNHTVGYHTVGNTLTIGDGATANGTYSLSGFVPVPTSGSSGSGGSGGCTTCIVFPGGSGGTSTPPPPSQLLVVNEFIGRAGTGTFNQTGGAHVVKNSLVLGVDSTGQGFYNLQGGVFEVDGGFANSGLFIGASGSGVFIHSGGANTVAHDIHVGFASGSSGSYTLSGNGVLSSGGSTVIGNMGQGTFSQSGGTFSVASDLVLGLNAGGVGTYSLSGGSLSTNFLEVGSSGTGTFTQSGGTNTVSTLTLGKFSGSSGTYNLNGGTLNVDYIVQGPGGTFNFNAGTLNTTSAVAVDAGGVMTVSGGTINGNINNVGTVYIGDTVNQTGNFTQTAGLLTVNGTLSTGGVDIQGGLLKGNGSIIGNVLNGAGILAVGNSPGSMTINGNYTQSAAGTFDAELGGLLAGVEYDTLTVTGTASLAGTLNVSFWNGFSAAAGDSFTIISSHDLQGGFDITNLAALDPSLSWHVDYLYDQDALGTDYVRLSVVAVPEPETYAMMLAGLGLVGAMARRRRPSEA